MMQKKHDVFHFPFENITIACKKNNVSIELVERFKDYTREWLVNSNENEIRRTTCPRL